MQFQRFGLKKKLIIASGISIISGLGFLLSPSNIVKAQGISTDQVQNVQDGDSNNVANSKNGTEEPSNIIASGDYGTGETEDTQWYITKNDSTLHLEEGTISNNDNKTKTSPWAKYSSNIKVISFDGIVKMPKYANYLFANLTNLTDFKNWDKIDATNLSYWTGTFSGDTSLTSIDLPDLKGMTTRGFLDLSHMFENDPSLKSIDLSQWDLNNAMTLEKMFANDIGLESVNVNFVVDDPYSNLASLKNVKNMFENDSALKTIDLSSWGLYTAGKVTDTSTMFVGTHLQSIKLSTLNQFTKNTVLPAKNVKRWVNIGNGTAKDPQGNKSFSTASISDYYDNSRVIRYPYSKEEKDKYFVDTFVPDPKRTANLVIQSNLGPQTVTDVSGNIGDVLNIKVPIKSGYTADKETVEAVVNENGTITTDESVKYSKQIDKNVISDVSIKSNLGNKVVKNVKGAIGQIVEVKVPDVSGYTHVKKTVKAKVNANGTITTEEKVIYKKIKNINIPTTHESNNDKAPQFNLSTENNLLATFSDQPPVSLYSFNSNNKMIQVTNRALNKNTDWYSDKKLKIGNNTYYRIATNEWVKANKVYIYKDNFINIETIHGTNKTLLKAEGTKSNRGLAPLTDWYSDRTTVINGKLYYRVATNEFVISSDVQKLN
ncbi:BspA family leucine-rich repeat surface protein [Companilactobacillus halodurans]|uniref:BspA family leucine-rich repeat surface protein n=1 Tax=Companilactobacillus halodurans TaxID=2584183 RepID=A0A5P0ZMH2_9LACO|nr:BspA family leucine-rich repeat surface protein [Companilactobacillus halodurans]MQS75031.1 BspA family leucine-rich repeat surface protein [Companilactobacillus halodurans]MQS97862.1 BspA family leucine-rich repeat surface protein [Companilactobacillus halodurans]